jgi:hypothetical protein
MDNYTHAAFFDELEKIAEATGAPEKSNLKRNLAIGGAALGTLALGLGIRKGLKMRALSRLDSRKAADSARRSSINFEQNARFHDRAAQAQRVSEAKAADAADAAKDIAIARKAAANAAPKAKQYSHGWDQPPGQKPGIPKEYR